MEKEKVTLNDVVRSNIRKAMIKSELSQVALATKLDTSESQISKLLNGTIKITVDQLAKFATVLSVGVEELLEHPTFYVKKESTDVEVREDVKAILQIELQASKKDQVLKLIFGENDIEILNK